MTNVAGKNVKVTTAMVFMAAPSSLAAIAIWELKLDIFLLTLLSCWDIMLESLCAGRVSDCQATLSLRNSQGLTNTCSLVSLFSLDTDLAEIPLSRLCKKPSLCTLVRSIEVPWARCRDSQACFMRSTTSVAI